MDANEPVVIHTTNNQTEAEILKNVLEGQGIKCELDSENQGSFAGLFAIRILVQAWDAEKAQHVIASHAHAREWHPEKQ